MKLASGGIQQVLWALVMFKGFYLEDRYNDRFSYKQRIKEAHWYLDYANGILDRAIKGTTYTAEPDDICSDPECICWHSPNPSHYSSIEPLMETFK
mgnify:CR=1 FL=1